MLAFVVPISSLAMISYIMLIKPLKLNFHLDIVPSSQESGKKENASAPRTDRAQKSRELTWYGQAVRNNFSYFGMASRNF